MALELQPTPRQFDRTTRERSIQERARQQEQTRGTDPQLARPEIQSQLGTLQSDRAPEALRSDRPQPESALSEARRGGPETQAARSGRVQTEQLRADRERALLVDAEPRAERPLTERDRSEGLQAYRSESERVRASAQAERASLDRAQLWAAREPTDLRDSVRIDRIDFSPAALSKLED